MFRSLHLIGSTQGYLKTAFISAGSLVCSAITSSASLPASAAPQMNTSASMQWAAESLNVFHGMNLESQFTFPEYRFARSGEWDRTKCIVRAFDYQVFGSAYCAADEKIVLDYDQLSAIHARSGDAGVAFVVAHEYAHHIQYKLGIRLKEPYHELQADCIAGAILSTSQVSGYLGLNHNDIKEVATAAYQAGGGHTHGSSDQRLDAVLFGLKSGNFRKCMS